MKMLNKIIALSLALIMISASFVSCKNSPSPIKSSEEELRTVMTVDGNDVPYELFRYFFMNFKNQFEQKDENVWTGADSEIKTEELDSAIVDAIRGVYAVIELCEKYGIGKDDKKIKDSVQARVEEVVDSYGGEKNYVKSLGENYMTDSVFRFLLAVDFMEAELYSAMIGDGTIDDSDEAALANINGPEFIRTIQIFIKNDPGDDIEDNRKTAESLLERINAGEDMDTLIGRNSEDLGMTPDGYYSTYLEHVKEYEDAAFALDIGEISEVVESSVGFHIIKRLAKEEGYINKNFEVLKGKYLTSAFHRAVNEKKNSLKVKKDSIYESFTVENMK